MLFRDVYGRKIIGTKFLLKIKESRPYFLRSLVAFPMDNIQVVMA